jgi:hypothetical protein
MTLTAPAPSTRRAGVTRARVDLQVAVEDGHTVITIRGDAGSSTMRIVADVVSRVIAVGTRDVVIDLTGADGIDADAVCMWSRADELLGDRHRSLTFRPPSQLGGQVLDLAGLSGLVRDR